MYKLCFMVAPLPTFLYSVIFRYISLHLWDSHTYIQCVQFILITSFPFLCILDLVKANSHLNFILYLSPLSSSSSTYSYMCIDTSTDTWQSYQGRHSWNCPTPWKYQLPIVQIVVEFLKPLPIFAEMLPGWILCLSSADNHSHCGFVSSMNFAQN